MSYMNFKGASQAPTSASDMGKLPGDFSLGRQSSIYSLTFDELQSNFSGLGKDFGSMNMDELLKNLWNVDESQIMTSAVPTGILQKQCSLTLPRTLSRKTVDEVWKDMFLESTSVNDPTNGAIRNSNGVNVRQNIQQPRQQNLGEITLEEFLVRAGVVKEEAQAQAQAQAIVSTSETGFYGDATALFQPNNNMGIDVSFQQPSRNTGIMTNTNRVAQNNIPAYTQTPSLALDIEGLRSLQQPQQQPKTIFSKQQANPSFVSPMNLQQHTPQLVSPARWSPIVAGPPPPYKKNGFVQNNIDMGTVNQLSPDVIGKSSISTPTFSPAPYAFGQGTRGRKRSGGFEKVVERRHRRMIKNRESAAKSRARKQAYTSDLEAEIVVLKEKNEELQKKQVEIIEEQNNQIIEKMKLPWGIKRVCLRRTLTALW